MRFKKKIIIIKHKANQISSQMGCTEPNLTIIKSNIQLPMNSDLISIQILKICPNLRNKHT